MKKNILSLSVAAVLALGRGLTAPPIFGSGSGTNDPRQPSYRRRGYSVAEGKRMARRRRNQLRAKGHYRQAVR